MAVVVQVQSSSQQLVTLLHDGKEIVTNVVVADERREIERRMKEVTRSEYRD